MYRKTDLAYLAGLIDGEGSIQIVHSTTKYHKHNFSLQVRIYSSFLPVLKKFRDTFKVGQIYTRMGTNKLIHSWGFYSNNAANILKIVLPYLIIKKKQSILGIKFQKYINKTEHRGKLLTTQENANREEYRFLISNLNSRNLGKNKKPVQYYNG